MTQEDLNTMKPSTTGTVKELFSEDENTRTSENVGDFEAQKDVIHFVSIHDMLSSFLVN